MSNFCWAIFISWQTARPQYHLREDKTFRENNFQSSGQLYISSFLWTHHQTVTKLGDNVKYLGFSRPKCKPNIFQKLLQMAVSGYFVFCIESVDEELFCSHSFPTAGSELKIFTKGSPPITLILSTPPMDTFVPPWKYFFHGLREFLCNLFHKINQ